MSGALAQLADVLSNMNMDKVPPPVPYKGKGCIKDFFAAFERYCISLYKGNTDSFLQVLPSFLEGEAKAIVNSFGFGSGVSYEMVRDRVIREMTHRRSLGSNNYSDFFSAKRFPEESLTCFSIRLEALANKITEATEEAKVIMVRSKFVGSLDAEMMRQMNVQLGYRENASLEEIVRLATVLENARPKVAAAMDWPVVASGQPLDVQSAPRAQTRDIRCFRCGQLGHYKHQCTSRTVDKSNVVCYKCDRKGHFARECRAAPNNRSAKANEACSFCGEGSHPLMECEKFRNQYMSCVWCGATTHASYTCDRNPAAPKNPSGNGVAPAW